MKKVYIVTQGEYSDYSIQCVFETREAAEKYCAVHSDESYYDMPNIEEWDVDDESNLECEHMYKALWFEQKYPENSKDIDYEMRYDCKPFKLDIQNNRKDEYGFISKGISGYIPVTKTVLDDEKAEKIILDHTAKWKAEQAFL